MLTNTFKIGPGELIAAAVSIALSLILALAIAYSSAILRLAALAQLAVFTPQSSGARTHSAAHDAHIMEALKAESFILGAELSNLNISDVEQRRRFLESLALLALDDSLITVGSNDISALLIAIQNSINAGHECLSSLPQAERGRLLSVLESLSSIKSSLLTAVAIESAALKEKKTLLTERSRTLAEFRLLAEDVGAMLGLPEEPVREDGESVPDIPLYREGLLADLPRVAGLADGVQDMLSLFAQIAGAGGEPKDPLPNTPLSFAQRFEPIRESVRDIAARLALNDKAVHEPVVRYEQALLEKQKLLHDLRARLLEAARLVFDS